ncbi:Xylanase inhibitor [Theobroma cacao]|nr:Xylanase inhibitor [Theobroma cacao]
MSELSSYSCVLLLVVLGLSAGSCCYGFGTFGFDIHHRYSDPVKDFLTVDELPAKGSLEYYSAMVHRDKIIKGRRLATANDQTPVTFLDGNETYRLSGLGFLYYANVSVGSPALSFLVALDTGSDLFWLPCDCSSCVQGLSTADGQTIDFNIYSPNTSSTSSKVPCSSDMCEQQKRCSSSQSNCPYQILYLSNGTSSTGVLVEDVLHLTTDEDKTKAVQAKITFGPTYNVSITQINVGGNAGDLDFSAVFDSGTSFTYLNDPAYTFISESFNNMAIEKRHTSDSSDLPFDYCYDLSANQTNFTYPVVNLTMKGGDSFFVDDPIVVVSLKSGDLYCLGVVKSDDVNIIGQNFMTGYRIVFDREKMVLGWNPSDCYDIEANTLPVRPPTAVPPAVAVNPEATAGNGNTSHISGASPPMANQSPKMKTLSYALIVALIPFFALI